VTAAPVPDPPGRGGRTVTFRRCPTWPGRPLTAGGRPRSYHRYASRSAAAQPDLGSAVAPATYVLARQKLICQTRDGAKVTTTCDVPATPQQRAERHPRVSAEDKTITEDVLAALNPGAIQRQLQARAAELLTLTTSMAAAAPGNPASSGPAQRASGPESTKPTTRILT
jgi:hypothetical protein